MHPGWFGSRVDLRATARYRDVVLPTSSLRELSAGPGVRTTLGKGVFLDLDAVFRRQQTFNLDVMDNSALDAASLAADDISSRGELDASFVVDRRNDGIEPTSGYLLALRGTLSPGQSLGSHRYVSVAPELRGFAPLSASWSVAARASAGFVSLAGESGVPLGARLFGGGAHGMRGFGRERLATQICTGMECELVGGMSLFQGSLEARYLPFRKLYGLNAFADLGGVGARSNPFADGPSAAVGFGARLRTWYVPISFDFSYRAVEQGEFSGASSLDPFLVFVRIGEAF